ncbi:unnamed protein product [Rotaria sordida]|uniref:Uncharacterized protein n=1 Tax=Rotaria sordida TaxID=392033 RepID=A0A819SYG8_9BILA|nr:unnamed protein product [Rotaria sordida]
MHLFLCWREMEDRIGTLGYSIETYLWGDSRARHTFLIACTDEHPLVFIEIDVGNPEKGIHKSMKLNIKELDEIPNTISKIEFIGETSSPIALPHLIKSAYDYVKEHPNYHVLLNNSRTFVEYLIDQMPEFHDSIPRRNGSILEYYHAQAKNEHPGALLRINPLINSTLNLNTTIMTNPTLLAKNITKANDKSGNHEIFEIRWSDFEIQFQNRYFSTTIIQKKFDKSRQRTHLHDESVASYIDDVINLCREINQTMSNSIIIQHLMNGINPDFRKKFLDMNHV